MIRILQFTDLHLLDNPEASIRGVNTARSFAAVVHHARQSQWPPDAILLTGDLGNDEYQATYPRLAALAKHWQVPVMVLPGNHDNAAAMSQHFNDDTLQINGKLEFSHWRIIGFDSQRIGAVEGEIPVAEYTSRIQSSDKHQLVTLHHHPLPLGSAWIDDLGLTDADAFRDHLAGQGVAACVFGHAHQLVDQTLDQVRYLGTPSTSSQFTPHTIDAEIDSKPPAYRWLELHDDGRIDTDIVWVNTPAGRQ